MNYETTAIAGSYPPLGPPGIKGWLFRYAWHSRSVSSVAERGANQRLAVSCTGVIDGGPGGVINDIAV